MNSPVLSENSAQLNAQNITASASLGIEVSLGVDGRLYTNLDRPLNKSEVAGIDVVWVPTQFVRFVNGVVPGKRTSEWQQALPYYFEESFAEPVEELFFKVMKRTDKGTKSGRTYVSVVAKEQMICWINVLTEHGLDNAQLLPDCFQLPVMDREKSTCWSAVEKENNLVVRTGIYEGIAGDENWIKNLVNKYYGCIALVDSKNDEFITPPKLSHIEISQYGLRSGEYQCKSVSSTRLKYWLPSMVMSIVLLVSLMSSMLIETAQLQKKQTMYVAQTKALFKEMLPEVKRIVNIRAQTRGFLAGTSDSQEKGFVELVTLVDSSVKKFPAVKVDKLDWQNEVLGLLLHSNNVTHLQAVEKDLSQSVKVSLEVKKVQQKNVTAQLVVYAK